MCTHVESSRRTPETDVMADVSDAPIKQRVRGGGGSLRAGPSTPPREGTPPSPPPLQEGRSAHVAGDLPPFSSPHSTGHQNHAHCQNPWAMSGPHARDRALLATPASELPRPDLRGTVPGLQTHVPPLPAHEPPWCPPARLLGRRPAAGVPPARGGRRAGRGRSADQPRGPGLYPLPFLPWDVALRAPQCCHLQRRNATG